MRCLSIAEQIRKMGAEVTFVTADERPCSLIRDRGFCVDVLDTVWDDLDQETEKMCSYLQRHKVETLLLDTYYVTFAYLSSLSRYTQMVYIDDLNRFAYPVHTLINYGAFIKKKRYEKTYETSPQSPVLLLGSQYIPLREEFFGRKYEVHSTVKRVLITTGGTDQRNVAGNFLERVLCNPALMTLEYHVIVGCFNRNREILYSLAECHPNIYLHENVTNMSEWMGNCDVAVSAAGTTTYELCACGIPSVCLEIADNQQGAAVWEERGYMFYAGNAADDMEQCIQKCEESILKYRESAALRKQHSLRMQSLVDGCGAKRIAEYLLR
jgi:UDP-2,4-diacetamido-2,4,6-trideoxy-beta-L-altropyranose hydrolase